jgi:hypothetical protein
MRCACPAIVLAALLVLPSGATGGIAEPSCVGDCDEDGQVTVDELLRGVRVALELSPPARCPNGGRGFWIDGLVESVRNALDGCATVRDFSAFERFEYALQPALGFCPRPGELGSAALYPSTGGLTIATTRVVASAPPACHPDADDCIQYQHQPCRRLTAAEVERVRSTFGAVTTMNGPAPECLSGVIDPCVITTARWDTSTFGDYPHHDDRLTPTERARLVTLLESLDDGAEVPCPPAESAVRTADIDAAVTFQTHALALEVGGAGRLTARTVGLGPAGFEIDVTVPADAVAIAPLRLPGLVCVCASFPPIERDVAMRGTITCDAPAAGVMRVRSTRDHNTSPGDPSNGGGLPDDLECDAVRPLPFGGGSAACLEGRDAGCSGNGHEGACNSPLWIDAERGGVARGSATVAANLSLTLLSDGGACTTDGPGEGGACRFADYGADCLPCTADDGGQRLAQPVLLTTGRAEAVIHDLNNDGVSVIAPDRDCLGIPCQAALSGVPFDCDRMVAEPAGGLDAVLVGALPFLDHQFTGDTVVIMSLSLR